MHRVAVVNAADFFEFPESIPYASHFDPQARPWDWISQIKPALAHLKGNSQTLELSDGVHTTGEVFFGEGVKLPPYCVIQGPAWIGDGVEIRPGAYIRGNVIIGADSVIGNSCEYKNCLLMERTQTPHFSYVGDSILGNGAHLGAGVILSNLRLDQKNVFVRVGMERLDTGLRKFGAILGDGAQVGCNTALMPGSIIGRGALVGPVMTFSGALEAGQLCMAKQTSRSIPLRD